VLGAQTGVVTLWGKIAIPEQRKAFDIRAIIQDEARERIKKREKETWEKKWKEGRKAYHLRCIAPERNPVSISIGRKKMLELLAF